MTADASAPNPLMAGSATEVETAAIVIFAGRYYSGMPYEDPATVFLKVRLRQTECRCVCQLPVAAAPSLEKLRSRCGLHMPPPVPTRPCSNSCLKPCLSLKP